jgi:hypothetical protein
MEDTTQYDVKKYIKKSTNYQISTVCTRCPTIDKFEPRQWQS